MSKVFEDYFSEAMTDMVDICAEYVDDRAEVIFIYSAYSAPCGGIFLHDFFYQFHGRIVASWKLNEVLEKGEEEIDPSGEVRDQVVAILSEDRRKINQACKDFQREIPAEIFITYDMRTKKFEAKCKYDPIKDLDDFFEKKRWRRREAAALGTPPID